MSMTMTRHGKLIKLEGTNVEYEFYTKGYIKVVVEISLIMSMCGCLCVCVCVFPCALW